MLILLWAAIKTAIIQILLACLTSNFMKELVLIALKKLAKHTDNDVDDQIVKLIEEAVRKNIGKGASSKETPRKQEEESESEYEPETCSKCGAILNK